MIFVECITGMAAATRRVIKKNTGTFDLPWLDKHYDAQV
jgi:hypothetical protein